MVLDRREIDTHEVLREEVLTAFIKNRSMRPETAHGGKTGWTKDELQDH